MFNHPTLLYHCWKDAKRESRNNPGNGGGGGCLLVIGIIFIICLWQAAIQVGGIGVFIAFAATCGFLSGFFGKE